MKKLLLILVALFTIIACTDNVKFNNPAFEAQKDNVFWRAIDAKATIAGDNSLTIEAYTRNEKVTLKTTSAAVQTYTLGTSTANTATYVLTDATGTITFATGLGIGEGRITIDEYDAVNNTVTGSFKFNAENINNNPLAGPILNFQYGHFYKIPISANTSLPIPNPGNP